jgi:hypothetical protein
VVTGNTPGAATVAEVRAIHCLNPRRPRQPCVPYIAVGSGIHTLDTHPYMLDVHIRHTHTRHTYTPDRHTYKIYTQYATIYTYMIHVHWPFEPGWHGRRFIQIACTNTLYATINTTMIEHH